MGRKRESKRNSHARVIFEIIGGTDRVPQFIYDEFPTVMAKGNRGVIRINVPFYLEKIVLKKAKEFGKSCRKVGEREHASDDNW